ncbi:antitoxin of toxin-antitoxin stability system [Labrys wisconsinensis]|uniref:Transcriptional regulator n=1 Tax=Labrys wisconsinensis TaxID=425677 RepID=A0ABU0JH33_9HYPH|nr:antitoxin of toxin-antitoxin stability system [Labrys wisconsinensis]MDQ0473604.1 putative transcriptional regulator [Labrys wisconsinensis]
MAKEAVFTLKLEPELRDAFVAAAEAAHRPASQVVRELMRDYIQRHQDEQDYDAFLRAKVAAARSSVSAGRGRPNDDVEADFARRRNEAMRRT